MTNKVSLFLDSGAHSIYEQVIRQGRTKYSETKRDYSYADSEEFWAYVDGYAEFIKKNLDYIDYYASVDVIFDPERSWKVQQYLEEEHKLSPLPVYHFGEDIKWMEKYVDNYEYICISGLGHGISKRDYYRYGDEVFSLFCDKSFGVPSRKIHGFSQTAIGLVRRWPWASVDSTTWVLFSAYGTVLVPTPDKMDYFRVSVSSNPSAFPGQKKINGKRIEAFVGVEAKYIFDYFSSCGYELGKSEFRRESVDCEPAENERWVSKPYTDGTRDLEVIVDDGLCNNWSFRSEMNAIFFRDLEETISNQSMRGFKEILPSLGLLKSQERQAQQLGENRKQVDQSLKIFLATVPSKLHLRVLDKARAKNRLLSYYFLVQQHIGDLQPFTCFGGYE